MNVTLSGGDGKDRAFKVRGEGGRDGGALRVRRAWWEQEGQGLEGKKGVVGAGRTGP